MLSSLLRLLWLLRVFCESVEILQLFVGLLFLNIYLVNLPLLYLPLPVSFLLLYVFLLLISSYRLVVSLVGGEFRIFLLQNPAWTTPLNFLSLLFHLCSLWSLSNIFFFFFAGNISPSMECSFSSFLIFYIMYYFSQCQE